MPLEIRHQESDLAVRQVLAVFVAIASGASVDAFGQADVPFRTRNLSPPVAIFALPSWQSVPDEMVIGASFELANHYRLSRQGTTVLVLDGETMRTNLHLEHPIGDRWSFGAELALIRQSGGILDDTVDAWHSIFRLPDGGRNARPEDVIEYRVGDLQQSSFVLNRSGSGSGDSVLSVARRVGTDRGLTVRASMKIATGDEAILAGSGATDLMVTLLRTRPVQLRRRAAGYYWGAGVVALNHPKLIPIKNEDFAVVAVAGGGLSIRPRIGLKAQLELHTPFYDSPFEELGQTSVQISMGGWWALREGARLDVAVSEDLHVSTAPDIVLHADFTWRW
jgi:hypothetical protein